jgi:hypothetical protein
VASCHQRCILVITHEDTEGILGCFHDLLSG